MFFECCNSVISNLGSDASLVLLLQGSWGSGKDSHSRELLVTSIFAAASRKRKKSKEKPQPSSSDDDLDAVFAKKEIPGQKLHHHHQVQPVPAEEKKGNGRVLDLTPKVKKEHRSSSVSKETTPPRHPSLSPTPNISGVLLGKSSLSDPPSQLDDNTSDLGTMSSGASAPQSKPKKWSTGSAVEVAAGSGTGPSPGSGPSPGPGASVGAEVSSITSDYSTTSSITFLTGAESSVLSPDPQAGEEADDERSELVSEGRPMETDSEGEFPVFAPGGGNSQSTPRHEPGAPERSRMRAEGEGSGSSSSGGAKRLFPTHKMIECDTLSRRWSLRQKTGSDSSVEASGEARGESATRLSRVLEVMKKGRSTSSLSSSSRSESERAEPSWHLRITERLKLRLRTSSDDMFALKGRSPTAAGGASDARNKKKNIRRRHTMAGQRDFAELAVIHDWREQGGVDQAALDCLKPRCSSQDLSIRDWVPRERCRAPETTAIAPTVAPRAVPEDQPEDLDASAERAPPSSPSLTAEHVNGGLQNKNKTNLGSDPHPQKLSGAQVVRSRFYQYL